MTQPLKGKETQTESVPQRLVQLSDDPLRLGIDDVFTQRPVLPNNHSLHISNWYDLSQSLLDILSHRVDHHVTRQFTEQLEQGLTKSARKLPLSDGTQTVLNNAGRLLSFYHHALQLKDNARETFHAAFEPLISDIATIETSDILSYFAYETAAKDKDAPMHRQRAAYDHSFLESLLRVPNAIELLRQGKLPVYGTDGKLFYQAFGEEKFPTKLLETLMIEASSYYLTGTILETTYGDWINASARRDKKRECIPKFSPLAFVEMAHQYRKKPPTPGQSMEAWAQDVVTDITTLKHTKERDDFLVAEYLVYRYLGVRSKQNPFSPRYSENRETGQMFVYAPHLLLQSALLQGFDEQQAKAVLPGVNERLIKH